MNIYCQLYWKDENIEKEARKGPIFYKHIYNQTCFRWLSTVINDNKFCVENKLSKSMVECHQTVFKEIDNIYIPSKLMYRKYVSHTFLLFILC